VRLKGYDYSQAGLYFITICCDERKCRFGFIENYEMVLNEFGTVAYNEWIKLPQRFPNVELDFFQIMPNHLHGIIALQNVGAGFTPTQNDIVQNDIVQNDIVQKGADQNGDVQNETVQKDTTKNVDVQNVNVQNETAQNGDVRNGDSTKNAIVLNDNVQNGGTGLNDFVQKNAVLNDTVQNDTIQNGDTVLDGDSRAGVNRAGVNRAGVNPAPTATIGNIVGAYKSLVTNACIDICNSQNIRLGKLWQRNYYEHIIRNEQSYHTIANYIINNPAKWHEDTFYTI